MERIRDALVEIPGTVSIEGHTDNVPTRGGRYESNWGLSASRALSVTHELLKGGLIDDARLQVVGLADTKPFTFNDTPDGRALNRRVEIVIRQGLEESDAQDLEMLRQSNPEAFDVLGL
jgi:chemotaxis protein MotB